MKRILLILIVGLVSIANAAQPVTVPKQTSTTTMFDPSLNTEWANFKSNHSKRYNNSSDENKRRKIFESNFKSIKAHNSDSSQTFSKSMNEFGDLTSDEFNAIYNKLIVNSKDILLKRLLYNDNQEEPMARAVVAALPTSVNWTSLGAVTPVKNQGIFFYLDLNT
jgi:hypothetical protein